MKDYTIEPITREELIGLCKYYKGEKKNPYDIEDIRRGFWLFHVVAAAMRRAVHPFHTRVKTV